MLFKAMRLSEFKEEKECVYRRNKGLGTVRKETATEFEKEN